MLIFLLALILFACLGYAGFAMGAIRAAAAFLGVLMGALLSTHIGHFFNPLITVVGLKNPLLVWALGPFLAFIVVMVLFKIAGHVVHRKVDVYYKYKGGDLRQGLFNRMNPRVGIGVGLMNAALYLILICWVIYVFSYITTQMVTGDQASWSVKMLNMAGRNLQSTGMAKVAASVDKMPATYYQAADIVGLIYHNDLLEGRLSRYPAFIALSERPEFQAIGSDKAFTELRQRQPPISEILDYPKTQAIVGNPDLLREIWATATPHLTDLQNYLKTGQSPEYDGEKILGRWDFDLHSALNAVKRAKSNINPNEMRNTRQILSLCFENTTLVISPPPDKLAIMKDYGNYQPPAKPNTAPTVNAETFRGQWTGENGKYELTFPDKGRTYQATVEGDLLSITGDNYPLVFLRE
jgi:hypothetical protein